MKLFILAVLITAISAAFVGKVVVCNNDGNSYQKVVDVRNLRWGSLVRVGDQCEHVFTVSYVVANLTRYEKGNAVVLSNNKIHSFEEGEDMKTEMEAISISVSGGRIEVDGIMFDCDEFDYYQFYMATLFIIIGVLIALPTAAICAHYDLQWW